VDPRPEVLAPGGSVEAIRAALAGGAAAVYLGVGALNARARARNLGPEQLPAVVEWIHGAGARVHVTLNLPLRETDVAEAARTLIACRDAGADAVILRDPLLMQAAREFAPDLEVHASTQFGVDSPAMARAARDLGCRRAVLARELSAARIRRGVQPGKSLKRSPGNKRRALTLQ